MGGLPEEGWIIKDGSSFVSLISSYLLYKLLLNGSKIIEIKKDTLETNIPGFFAGGEVINSPSSVVDAIEMGRKAASSIDKYLGGIGEIDDAFVEPDVSNPWLGRDEYFYDKLRAPMPLLSLEERQSSFNEIELGLMKL